MGLQSRLLVLTLIGILVLFDVTKGQGGRECYHEGTLNVVPVNYTSVGSQLIVTVEGIVQICNSNQEYESVCDIGWDTEDAHVVCSYFPHGEYVSEALSGLGFPRRRYSSRTYNCSTSDYSLRSCNYRSSIDPECHNGPHVAGVRCTEVITIGFADTSYTVSESVGTFQVDVQVFNPRDDQPLPLEIYIALVIQTIPGTATGGSDYEVNDDFLIFGNAHRRQSFSVTIVNDLIVEDITKSFTLKLGFHPSLPRPSNVRLSPNVSVVTILDDDEIDFKF